MLDGNLDFIDVRAAPNDEKHFENITVDKVGEGFKEIRLQVVLRLVPDHL
jgi:hypothetical protein